MVAIAVCNRAMRSSYCSVARSVFERKGESDTTLFLFFKIKKKHPSPGGPEASPPGRSPLGDTTYHEKSRRFHTIEVLFLPICYNE